VQGAVSSRFPVSEASGRHVVDATLVQTQQFGRQIIFSLQCHFGWREAKHRGGVAAVATLIRNHVLHRSNFNAIIYLVGTPNLDASNGAITFPDLRLEAGSHDFLRKRARWLLNTSFEQNINSQFRIPIFDRLASLRLNLLRDLNQSIDPQLTVHGDVNPVDVQWIYVTATGITMFLEVSGNVSGDFILP
jgi:hypothetical protein